jgi:hypothetical protein
MLDFILNVFNHILNFGLIVSYAAKTSDAEAKVTVTNVVDTNGRDTVGGGEILHFIGNKAEEAWYTMNEAFMNQLHAVPYVKLFVCFLILFILILIIFNLLGLGNGLTYGGVDAELANISRLKKRDAYIIKRNKQLARITDFIEGIGLGVDKGRISYLEYNLKRAGVKNPGGQRILTPQEYNAIIRSVMVVFVIAGCVLMLFNGMLGFLVALLGVVVMSVVPDALLRDTVLQKDRVIRLNFFDFYGELHYPIVGNEKEPLVKILRNYAKVDLVPEMREFTNNVADIFDLHGEYEGTKYVAQEYKEIPEVTKLMRLIKQYLDNADVVNDMNGFREQLLLQQQMQIDKACEKIIRKARSSFYIIYIILFQAILSAMLIYVPDLGNISSLF